MALIIVTNYMLAISGYFLSLTVLELITHIVVCYYIVQIAKFVLFLIWNIIKQFIPLNDILTKYSQSTKENSECWAVVTGATDGIGLGFAEVLTQLGFDVCLISRNQQKLNKTVENLKKIRPQKFSNKKFLTVQFDFTNCSDLKLFNEMIQKFNQLDIGILVNNVGTNEVRLSYEKLTQEQIKKIINVNCTSMALMTSALLKQMKNRKSKSAIINLSSFTGQCPIPYVTLYSATKAMNTFFSEGITHEYPQLDILSLRPMFVESPLSKQKKGLIVPDRRQCAMAALKQLRWQYETNGYFLHRIFAKMHQLFVPTFLQRFMIKRLVNPQKLVQQYQ